MDITCGFYLGIKDNLIANDKGIPVIEHILDEFLCVEFAAHFQLLLL